MTVELLFGEQDQSDLGPHGDTLTLRGGDVMWQKERLLQIGIDKLLLEGWGAVAWLDADITFCSPNWHDRILRSLDRFDCVHSFEALASHFAEGSLVHPSIVRRSTSCATGGSWAATCEFWKRVPLYQHCVIGGGDGIMATIFLEFGQCDPPIRTWNYTSRRMRTLNGPLRRHIVEWAKQAWGNWRVGCVAGQRAQLLRHGSRRLRNYVARHAILRHFDPVSDIAQSPSGPWVWSSPKPLLHRAVASYFVNRREDD